MTCKNSLCFSSHTPNMVMLYTVYMESKCGLMVNSILVVIPDLLSYINQNIPVVVLRIKLRGCYCLQIVVYCGLKRNCGM